MGTAASHENSPDLQAMDRTVLAGAFARFVEANCIQGSDKSVHIQKLEAAFAFYLAYNDISVSNLRGRCRVDVVHAEMQSLLSSLEGPIRISPGYTGVAGCDTRYVVGIDVVRFQK